MEILNYKSKFKLILDIIFNPNEVDSRVSKKIQIAKDALQMDFDEKIKLVEYDHHKKGVVSGKHSHPVLRVPVFGIEKMSMECLPHYNTVTMEDHPINNIKTSYTYSGTMAAMIKEEAARNISHKLIEEGFLQSEFKGNEITFSINCFGI